MVGQLIKTRNGEKAEFNLDGLAEFYGEVAKVNKAFTKRIKDAAEERTGQDANLNALVKLSIFSQLGSYKLEKFLNEIEQLDNLNGCTLLF